MYFKVSAALPTVDGGRKRDKLFGFAANALHKAAGTDVSKAADTDLVEASLRSAIHPMGHRRDGPAIVLQRGWLRKQSPSTLAPWQHRWCVLTEKEFLYFARQENEDSMSQAKVR